MKRLTTVLFAIVIAFSLFITIGCASGSDAVGNGGSGSAPDGGSPENAKIIVTASMNVETQDFDGFIDNLYDSIKRNGAYTESERLGTNETAYATVVIRVPAEKFTTLREEINTLGNVTSYNSNKQDVTLTYETLVSREQTLALEVEVVEGLFEEARKSGNLNSIYQIEQRLTELKKELNEVRAQIKVINDKVSYSTLTVSVREVVVYTEVNDDDVFGRIGMNLRNGFVNVWNAIVEIFIFLISAIPYLLLIGFIVSCVLVPIFLPKKIRRKRAQKAQKAQENKQEKKGE